MESLNFTELFKTDTIGDIISLSVLGLAALFILSGIFFGLSRGFSKSVVRLLTVVAAAFASFFICKYAFGWLSGFLQDKSLEDVIRIFYKNYDTSVGEKYRDLISAIDSSTAFDLTKLIIALVMPFIFVFVFYIAKGVFFLVYLIISAMLGKTSYRKGFFSAIFGMVVGAVQGAFIAAVILLPLSGYAGIAGELRTQLAVGENSAEEPSLADKAYSEVIDGVIANPLLGAINTVGGAAFRSLMTIDTAAGVIDTGEEMVSIADIAFSCAEIKGESLKELSPSGQEKLENVRTKLKGDAYLSSLIAGVLRSVADGVSSGAVVLPAPDPFGSLLSESITVFSSSDKDNLDGDVKTVLNVYYILSDHKIIVSMDSGSSDEVLNALVKTDADGNTAISLIIDEFEKNERMSFMISNITKLSVSIMSGSLGLDEEAEQVYVALKDDIKEALEINLSDYETEEEYKEAVSTKVTEALTSQNITLSESEISGITDHIAENYSDITDISDKDIDTTLLSYYDAYLKSLENGETPELPELPGTGTDAPEIPEGEPSTETPEEGAPEV